MLNKLLNRKEDSQEKSAKKPSEKSPVLETLTYTAMGLYLILAIVFWSSGRLGKLFFVGLSIGMILLLLSSVFKFVLILAAAANGSGKLPWGLLFAKGIFGLTIPFLLMHVVGSLMIALMPHCGCEFGIIFDFFRVVRTVYTSLHWPFLTDLFFAFSLIFNLWLLGQGLKHRNG